MLHLTKTAPSGCDISARPAPAYLHHSSYGKWPSQEPQSRLSFRIHRFSCTVFAICLSQQIFDFFSHTGYGDGSFLHFGKSLHHPTPVRCNGSVFARKMHSTTEFAMTVLSKCVTPVGSKRCRETLGEYPPGRMLDPLTCHFSGLTCRLSIC